MLQFFGIASGVVTLLSVIPYIKDILSGSTKPERASWLIWSLLGLIAFFSQFAEGATWSLWLTGLDTIGVILVFLLAIKYGEGGMTRRDVFALIAAAVGLVCWYLTSHAYYGIFSVIFVDITGTYLTVIKAYQNPASETMSTWFFMSVAGLLGALAVGEFNFILLAYPGYLLVANFAVVVAILLGKNNKKRKKV